MTARDVGGLDAIRNFDYELLKSSGFKEDSVREELVKPLLTALGYSANKPNQIRRSVTLKDPWLKTGSGKRKITYFPDYVLEVNGKRAWVMDAKAPGESVTDGGHVGQVYGYARHHEIKVDRFALCNGHQLAVYADNEQHPLLVVDLREVEHNWTEVVQLLAPEAFASKGASLAVGTVLAPGQSPFDYMKAVPPKTITDIQKQTAKRHHGIHGYFTKQVHSVVQTYIRTLSKPGDVVFDPFGGGGVTAIEAVMADRVGIHLDLNPLSVFMVQALVAPIDEAGFAEVFHEVVSQYERQRPRAAADHARVLRKHWYPKDVPLPPNSDVDFLHQIYNNQQLAELALLRSLISEVKNENYRTCLLLMFSSTLNKINLTYHSSGTRSAGRGDSAIFRYYRYRMAPEYSPQDTIIVFRGKYKRLIEAKREIFSKLRLADGKQIRIMQGTATHVELPDDAVDYIYTDPPYGEKINYLDLSVMWNAWLQFPVSEEDMQEEIIEGGSREKSIEDYRDLMRRSMTEMYRVLKFDRWMSFVFAHKDPAYWHLIIQAAEEAGFEYHSVVRQNNGQSSFKKRQKPFKVLQGQLIINFRKVRSPKALAAARLGTNLMTIVRETIEETIALHHGATMEEINDALVIRGLEQGFLHVLSQQLGDVTPYVESNFAFDPSRQVYLVQTSRKLGSHIDLNIRAEYYVVSYLREQAKFGKDPSLDDVVLSVLPLLKNGITPDKQTITAILEKVAVHVGVGQYRIKPDTGQIAFDLK